MDNNIRNTKRTSLHHRPTKERARAGGGLNDGRKHIITSNDSGSIHFTCRIHSFNGLDR
ncbi:hypothetical protein BwiPL1_56590 (plasmid) [Bacillus wiedmannii]|nr:hypothetical protein BwiPL1_56590 [Bacillus wiedmannii]